MVKALVQCSCYVVKASLSYQFGAQLVKKSPIEEGKIAVSVVKVVHESCAKRRCNSSAQGAI